MISVEEFLAAHPVPAAPRDDAAARRPAGNGCGAGGPASAADESAPVASDADRRSVDVADGVVGDDESGFSDDDADRAAAQAIADGGTAMDVDVDADMGASADPPRPVSRFGGTFGASRDDDVVRYARGGRRARDGRRGRRERRGGYGKDGAGAGLGGRRRSSGGFAYTPTDDPHDEERCKEAALRLLDAAARSTGALRAKLAERGYADDVIGRVVERLTELRLLDDEEYARSVARSCVNRMMGMRGAVMEMTRKGVDRALATRVAAEAADDGVFVDAAWALGRSVAARTRGKDPQTAHRRFWSAGGRKGHDPQTLREVSEALFAMRGSDMSTDDERE